MTTAQPALEVIDLTLHEVDVADEHDGGMVEYSVKELLLEIRQTIEREGKATKAELDHMERRLADRIVSVDQAAKERVDVVHRDLTDYRVAQAERERVVDAALQDLTLWKARIMGAAAVATLIGGAIGAAIGQVFNG